MAVTEELLESFEGRHLIQLYEADKAVFLRNVGDYLVEGILAGANLLVVAIPEHLDVFRSYLRSAGINVETVTRTRRFQAFSAPEMLDRFMVNDRPDPIRFSAAVGETVCAAYKRADFCGLRAYGEMVGVLWQQGQFLAAIRLEELWNALQRSIPFSLYCGYPIDIFDSQEEHLPALLHAHSHLVPTGRGDAIERAILQAIDETTEIHFRGVGAATAEIQRAGWAKLPNAEALALWVRLTHPQRAPRVLSRAKEIYNSAR